MSEYDKVLSEVLTTPGLSAAYVDDTEFAIYDSLVGENLIFSTDIGVDLVESSASDNAMIASARVSVLAEGSLDYLEIDPEESVGLINFLIKGRHGSPSEHNMFTFFVNAPIFVLREWHRHRAGWSYNETSGRYRRLEPVFYVPPAPRNLMEKPGSKAGHYEYIPGTPEIYTELLVSMVKDCVSSYREYRHRLEMGIAKEVARMTLPVNIYSPMYATCNARSLMHFLGLRTARDNAMFPSKPMAEIDVAASKMEEFFAALMPITHEAFDTNGRVAP